MIYYLSYRCIVFGRPKICHTLLYPWPQGPSFQPILFKATVLALALSLPFPYYDYARTTSPSQWTQIQPVWVARPSSTPRCIATWCTTPTSPPLMWQTSLGLPQHLVLPLPLIPLPMIAFLWNLSLFMRECQKAIQVQTHGLWGAPVFRNWYSMSWVLSYSLSIIVILLIIYILRLLSGTELMVVQLWWSMLKVLCAQTHLIFPSTWRQMFTFHTI